MRDEFLSLIEKMRVGRVDFPEEFKMYYYVEGMEDRRGKSIRVTPYLLESRAKAELQGCQESGDGKYWSDANDQVYASGAESWDDGGSIFPCMPYGIAFRVDDVTHY
jgi:hypothetical protein